MMDNAETATTFAFPTWYQERYFLGALQQEIDAARRKGDPLCLIMLRMEDYSRRAARHLYAYAESAGEPAFFGVLDTGDYAICMPGRGYEEGTRERVVLNHSLSDFGVKTGLVILDDEETASELLNVAAHDMMRHRGLPGDGGSANQPQRSLRFLPA